MKKSLNERFYHQKLLKGGFFDEIEFSKEAVELEAKETILRWMFNLMEYRKIKIEKFSMFLKMNENVVLPVKIIYFKKYEIEFIDNLEKKYYLVFSPVEYYNLECYSIGIRNSSDDIEVSYKITGNNEIIKLQLDVIKLNSDGTNSDNMYTISYNDKAKITKILFTHDKSTIEVSYVIGKVDHELENKIIYKYFSSIKELDKYLNDTYFLFKYILDLKRLLSLDIKATIGKNIVSKISLFVNSVVEYSYTENKNYETCFHKYIVSKELCEFIREQELLKNNK